MQQTPASKVSSSETLLDVRGMKAPDNIVTVLKKAGELSHRAAFQFQIDSNPFQLYDLLQQRGYFLEMQPQPDGTFVGIVQPRKTAPAD